MEEATEATHMEDVRMCYGAVGTLREGWHPASWEMEA